MGEMERIYKTVYAFVQQWDLGDENIVFISNLKRLDEKFLNNHLSQIVESWKITKTGCLKLEINTIFLEDAFTKRKGQLEVKLLELGSSCHSGNY